MSGWALGAAAANVIMQLSLLPIGHGVAKSTVDSGRADKHPLKRFRTTISYLVIALYGTESERDAMRREVNRSHTPVRSAPEEAVQYNAFDPELQLWVAACLYWGLADLYERMHGSPDASTADEIYFHSSRLATTLQVTDDMWPASREDFRRYWDGVVGRIQMDELTRGYLLDLAQLKILPFPVRSALGPFHLFVTTGFLPPRFRAELGLSWSASHQRAFDGLIAALSTANRLLPRAAREFPLNFYLWDARRRIRSGHPIV
jgi:uncharacterized protein (DUF2236 family)